jgi:hypothetical protein
MASGVPVAYEAWQASLRSENGQLRICGVRPAILQIDILGIKVEIAHPQNQARTCDKGRRARVLHILCPLGSDQGKPLML